MIAQTLEERIRALERKVSELEAAIANGERPKDWRRTIGIFAGDEVMGRIFGEALKYRERDRERARRRYAKKTGRQKK